MATSAEPARLPHLANERRAAIRKPLPANSLIELQPGGLCSARDVGEGGMSLLGSTDLKVGADTILRFVVPGSETQLEACGVIAWTDDLATGIRFTEIDSESLASLQNWVQAAIPIENGVRTDAVLAAKVACLSDIADLQSEISSLDLDEDAALALIVRRMAELTRATGAAIALRDGQGVICRASYGNAPDVGVQLSQSSLSGECLRTANVVLLHDSETDPRVDAEICRQLNFRSLLIVPVLSHGKTAGIAEVLSPNPRNFEGGDILVVSFIADLIAGVAVRIDQSDARATELRTNVEPPLEPDLPKPEIAFEVPIPTAPCIAPAAVTGAAEPIKIAPTETVAPQVRKPSSARLFASPAAGPATMPFPVQTDTPEVQEITSSISIEDDGQKRLHLIVALLVLFLIAVAAFAIFRFRQPAPAPLPSPAKTTVATPAANATASTESVFAPITEPVKAEQRKASASPTRGAKPSADSHNGAATQEVAVRESSPPRPTGDAPPDAPSVGQLSARSSADLTAEIVATRTPTPQLNPVQSSGVVEGKLIKKVLPHYPEMARRAGVAGDVVLSAIIGVDGKLKNIKVLSGSPLLREEAIIAARQWRYSPYLLGGKPVETDTRITISFKH